MNRARDLFTLGCCALMAVVVARSIVPPARADDETAVAASLPLRSDFDAGRSETWDTSVTAAHRELDGISQALIRIVSDVERPNEDRRQAALALGKAGTKAGLEFLAQNIELRIPIEIISGDGDRLLQTPCRYALLDCGWSGAAAVFASLETAKTKQERIWYPFVLKETLGKRQATALAKAESESTRDVERKENLVAIAAILSQY